MSEEREAWEIVQRQDEEDEAAYAEWSEFVEEIDYRSKLAISYPQDAQAAASREWLDKYATA